MDKAIVTVICLRTEPVRNPCFTKDKLYEGYFANSNFHTEQDNFEEPNYWRENNFKLYSPLEEAIAEIRKEIYSLS